MKYKSRMALSVMTGVSLLIGMGFFGVNYLHTSIATAEPRTIVSYHKQSAVGGRPVNFGKTHFIVGQTHDHRQQQEPVASDAVAQSMVLFSPDDDIRTHLIDFIEHEQESISIAVFVFTDKHIARALIDAFKRGVKIEVVTDATGLRDRYNRIRDLCDAQIPVFVYDAQHGKAGLSSVMHNKFVIFKKNKSNQPCVWTGSCNFTKSACESNQESAVILINAHTEQFDRQFGLLKTRSYHYKK